MTRHILDKILEGDYVSAKELVDAYLYQLAEEEIDEYELALFEEEEEDDDDEEMDDEEDDEEDEEDDEEEDDELEEETLEEARRVRMVRKGKVVRALKKKKGFKRTGNRYKKLSGSEKVKLRRSAKKAKLTKRSKGAALKKRTLKKRKKSLRRRKLLGIK